MVHQGGVVVCVLVGGCSVYATLAETSFWRNWWVAPPFSDYSPGSTAGLALTTVSTRFLIDAME